MSTLEMTIVSSTLNDEYMSVIEFFRQRGPQRRRKILGIEHQSSWSKVEGHNLVDHFSCDD